MADDERRAELEAVARAWWAHDPAAFDGLTDEWRALQMRRAEAAIAALDRVRDARRDDDEAARAAAQHREDTSKLVAAGVRITELENEVERLHARLQRWEAGLAATEELQLVRDARRDDEAGIEAAARELGRWRPVNDTAMVARVVVDAYLLEMRGGERDG